MGGALKNFTDGSAAKATATLANCTFFENVAPAGGNLHNGGALSGNPTMRVGNCLFKAAATGTSIVNNSGTFVTLGFNLSSDNGGGVLNCRNRHSQR